MARVYKVNVPPPGDAAGKWKYIGGSTSDDFNKALIAQAVNILPPVANAATRERQHQAIIATIKGIQPRDEIEGMLAAQLAALHIAAMECLRIAHLENATFEGRHANLNQANKLNRSYALSMEALNRYRGKGQQKVTVEHVHVHQGGQAIVGAITRGGVPNKPEEQPHAPALAHQPKTPMRRANPKRQAVPITTGNGEDPL